MEKSQGGTSLWNCGRPMDHPGPCQPEEEVENTPEKPAINFENIKLWPTGTWFQNRLKEVRSR